MADSRRSEWNSSITGHVLVEPMLLFVLTSLVAVSLPWSCDESDTSHFNPFTGRSAIWRSGTLKIV